MSQAPSPQKFRIQLDYRANCLQSDAKQSRAISIRDVRVTTISDRQRKCLENKCDEQTNDFSIIWGRKRVQQ